MSLGERREHCRPSDRPTSARANWPRRAPRTGRWSPPTSRPPVAAARAATGHAAGRRDRRVADPARVDDLLPLRAGLAVADIAGPERAREVAERRLGRGPQGRGHPRRRRARPRAGDPGHRRQRPRSTPATLPTPDVAAIAGTLGPRRIAEIEPTLTELLGALGPPPRRRSRRVACLLCASATHCSGSPSAGRTARATGAGIDDSGALLVTAGRAAASRALAAPAKSRSGARDW